MDPITAAGIGMSITSLMMQAFAGCVQGYQLFVEMKDMPGQYNYLRVRLSLEQARLLNWGDKIGLLHDRMEKPSQILKMKRNIVLDVLLEIHETFQQTLHTTKKFDAAVRSDTSNPQTRANAKSLLRRSLAILDKTADVSLRLQWVMVKQSHFKSMIDRLIDYNGALEGLLDATAMEELHQMHVQTNMTLLQLSDKIDQLESLSQALLHQTKSSHSRSFSRAPTLTEGSPYDFDEGFSRLAQFKAQKIMMETRTDGFPSRQIPRNEIDIRMTSGGRPLATLGGREFWVEWRKLSADHNPTWDKTIRSRIEKISSLLGSKDNPPEFRAPFCLGYFTERTHHNAPRYGLLYTFPWNTTSENGPISLHDLFALVGSPSLNKRVRLAHQISQSLMFLHSVNWIHKGVNSHAIIFPSTKRADMDEPVLSGYDFARPDLPSEITERPAANLETDIYRHPDLLQVDWNTEAPPRRSTKSHDIYALGLILIEIAFWKPLKNILAIEFDQKGARGKVLGARENILASIAEEEGVLPELGSLAGEKFKTIVQLCLAGSEGAKGLPEHSAEEEKDTAVELQHVFREDIVERLKSIKL